MKKFLVFLFNVLLFNGCLASNIHSNSTHGEFQHHNSTGSGTIGRQIDEDFQYAIFDTADLAQILAHVKDPRLTEFVKKHVFPVKYRGYSFNLQIENRPVLESAHSRSIYIFDYDTYLEILEQFGESIQRIESFPGDSLQDEEQAAELYQSINEHCSDSLTYFYLGILQENTFVHFTKPFTKLKSIQFFIGSNRAGSVERLDEIFPELRRLSVGFYDTDEEEPQDRYIDSDFPHMEHLEHLHLIIENRDPENRLTVQNQLIKMFQNNTQIRTLMFAFYMDADFIQILNQYLPNLEYISTNFDPNITAVHFDHVRRLRLSATEPPLDRISFSHLESIEMHYVDLARDSWIEFFKRHQHLKELICSTFTVDELTELVSAELPNLSELRIMHHVNFDIDVMSQLIEGRKNWHKFEYESYSEDQPDAAIMATLREKFGNDWNIGWSQIENRLKFTFERKN